MFNFVLITAILYIIYMQTTKKEKERLLEDGDFVDDNKLLKNNILSFKDNIDNLDGLIFSIAKKNDGVISIPLFCIEARISATEANRYLLNLEKQGFISSSYSKKMSQIVYYVSEFLTQENKKDLDLYD